MSVSTDGANEIAFTEQGTSPIVWRVPESSPEPPEPERRERGMDIALRRGWKPSLGPDMFNLGGSQNSGLARSYSSDSFSSDSTLEASERMQQQRTDTDV